LNYLGSAKIIEVFLPRISLREASDVDIDHNILRIKYFAADEAQSLAAIFRNEEGAIDGMSVLPPLRGVLYD
jgi:hypothetical protein